MSTIGERIGAARKRAGVTQAQLADALGRDTSAVSRIENGERRVSSFELALIAELTNTSATQLLGLPAPSAVMRVAARVASAPKGLAGVPVRNRIRRLLEMEALLEGLGALSPPNVVSVPEVHGRHVDQGSDMAAWARDEIGLGGNPVPDDMPWIVEEFGLDVLVEPMDDALDGLCIRFDKRTLAIINGSSRPERQRFTLGHELAHHLFQDPVEVIEETVSFAKGPSEMRANAFAAAFLMPAEATRRFFREDGWRRPEVVANFLVSFGVSLEALSWRLVNLEVITKTQREDLLSLAPAQIWHLAGRGGHWESGAGGVEGAKRLPSRLKDAALKAYSGGHIGIGPVADLYDWDDAEQLREELAAAGVVPSPLGPQP